MACRIFTLVSDMVIVLTAWLASAFLFEPNLSLSLFPMLPSFAVVAPRVLGDGRADGSRPVGGLTAAGVVVASNRLGVVPDAGLIVAGRRPPGVGAGVDMNINLARQFEVANARVELLPSLFSLEKTEVRTLWFAHCLEKCGLAINRAAYRLISFSEKVGHGPSQKLPQGEEGVEEEH